MITLDITIGGHLAISLDKYCKNDLKDLIEKANKDGILTELLEAGGYLSRDWQECTGVLTEAPIIAYASIYKDNEEVAREYKHVWYYPNYRIDSFAKILLRDKIVIFKRMYILNNNDEFPNANDFFTRMKNNDYLESTIKNVELTNDWIKIWKPQSKFQKFGLWMWSNSLQKIRSTTIAESPDVLDMY